MCKKGNVNKNRFLRATGEPYSFAYIDKINKTMRKNFNENMPDYNKLTKKYYDSDYKEFLISASLESIDTDSSDTEPAPLPLFNVVQERGEFNVNKCKGTGNPTLRRGEGVVL